jgi:hypothetical protein
MVVESIVLKLIKFELQVKSISINDGSLLITARQLREFALPGALHRLIVPVASMEWSRWAAEYGAVFAKSGTAGFAIALR